MDNRKQRELKFRAWNRFKNEMFDPMPIVDFKIYEINAITLMQYTGLKDKNGKEIYEGDVIALHLFTQELGEGLGVREGERVTKGVIEFREFGLAFIEGEGDDNWFYLVYAPGMIHEESFEVIGNLYETPDLLTPQPNP